MLLAEWKDAPEYGRSHNFVSYCMTRGGLVLLTNYYDFLRLLQTNTYQGLVITDFNSSFAVFIYKCYDLEFSGSATIGFMAGNVLFSNHRISGNSAKNIACINYPERPWVNLVYKLTREDLLPVLPTGICKYIIIAQYYARCTLAYALIRCLKCFSYMQYLIQPVIVIK